MGNIVDIRTRRALARTSHLSELFVNSIQSLVDCDVDFYLVHGRCRTSDVRALVTALTQTLNEVPIIYDPQMPADQVLLYGGNPEELGFAV